MKISFAYGSFSLGDRPIDFNNLMDSPRGLTGSELSCISLAKEMASSGHDVTLYIPHANNSRFLNFKLQSLSHLEHDSHQMDAVISWNEPDILRNVSIKSLRIVNQQLNDFGYCKPGFDNFVDVYTSPSRSHMDFIKMHTPSPHKWTVLPNGCDPGVYDLSLKVPNRVIYASSPDRGLHLLLQVWPKIKKAVPDAELHIFYNMDKWLNIFVNQEYNPIVDLMEYGMRARYIDLSIRRMERLGVFKVGSVSRSRMATEMSKATVLAYPCDTVRFTEGFSVTTLEACASGTIPVISNVDSLGQIYGGIVPTVQSPVRSHMHAFAEFVVKSLKDEVFRQSIRDKAMEFANQHKWSVLSQRLEQIIMDGRKP